jgi:hypothetical protein
LQERLKFHAKSGGGDMSKDLLDKLPEEKPGPPAKLTLCIFNVLSEIPECEIDELAKRCAPYTWNAVFFEVDRLTRTGELCLHYRPNAEYAVSLPSFPQAV